MNSPFTRCCCGCHDCSEFDESDFLATAVECDRALQDTNTSNPLYGPAISGSIATDCGTRVTKWKFIRYFGEYVSAPSGQRCAGVLEMSLRTESEEGWRVFRSRQYKTLDDQDVYMFARSHSCSLQFVQFWISTNASDTAPPSCDAPGGDYLPVWEMDSTFDPEAETDPTYRIDHKWGAANIVTGWKFKGLNWPKSFYGPTLTRILGNVDLLQSGEIETFEKDGFGVWHSIGTLDVSQKHTIPYLAFPSAEDSDHLFPGDFSYGSGEPPELDWICRPTGIGEIDPEYNPKLYLWDSHFQKDVGSYPPPYDQLSVGTHTVLSTFESDQVIVYLSAMNKDLAELNYFYLWLVRTHAGLTYRTVIGLFQGTLDHEGAGHFENFTPITKSVAGLHNRWDFRDVVLGSFDVLETTWGMVD